MGIDMGLAFFALPFWPSFERSSWAAIPGASNELAFTIRAAGRMDIIGYLWYSLVKVKGYPTGNAPADFFFVSRTCKSVFFVSELQF